MTLKTFCELFTMHHGDKVKVWILQAGTLKAEYVFTAPVSGMAHAIRDEYLAGNIFSVDVIYETVIISVILPTGLNRKEK